MKWEQRIKKTNEKETTTENVRVGVWCLSTI